MKFEYQIIEGQDLEETNMNFTSSRDPSSEEKILIHIVDGKVQISGNKMGWEYLAKICFEMSYCADKDPYFHLHRKDNLVDALSDDSVSVSFFVKD